MNAVYLAIGDCLSRAERAIQIFFVVEVSGAGYVAGLAPPTLPHLPLTLHENSPSSPHLPAFPLRWRSLEHTKKAGITANERTELPSVALYQSQRRRDRQNIMLTAVRHQS